MGTRRKNIPVEVQARITKFYVSNLPDRCSGLDLALVLRGHGSRGDGEEVIIYSHGLSFNVARFVLEDGEVNARGAFKENKRDSRSRDQSFTYNVNKDGGVNNMSFNEAFTGAAVGRTIKIDDNIMAFEEFHGRAVVVRVNSMWVLKNIRNILKEMGLAEGEIQCLG
ncbi:hypothetical protein Hanom_Chr09g00819111 [Helianthus anomalus]